MKLTPFGETARLLRMRVGASLKAMADYMDISSSYLSSIEYGDKRLAQKHIDKAAEFFKEKVTDQELANLLQAAARSKDQVSTSSLTPDARGLVAAFARRLQDGDAPTADVINWINSKKKGE